MERQVIEISDHALVRWMHRTGLLDLDPIKDLLRASLLRAAEAAGVLGVDEYLILADGLVFVVRDAVVVTVLPEDGRHSRIRALSSRVESGPRA